MHKQKILLKLRIYFEHGVLSGIHEGSVDNILDSYDTMVKVAQENNYDIIGSPTEVLVKKYSQCRQRRRIYY